MFYRVSASIFFLEQDEAVDFYRDCKLALVKGNVINPGQPNEEKSAILLQLCHHDESPALACEVMDSATLP